MWSLRRPLALALVTAMLVGCSSKAAAPKQSAGGDATRDRQAEGGGGQGGPDAAPPTGAFCSNMTLIRAILTVVDDGGLGRTVNGPAECAFTTGTGTLTIGAARIVASSRQEAIAAVQATGGRLRWGPQAEQEKPDNTWRVSLTLAAGAPGEQVTVSVVREPGAQPARAVLTRKVSPSLKVLVQGADGAWAPLNSGSSRPAGPLRLRLQATGVPVEKVKWDVLSSEWAHLTPEDVHVLAPDRLEFGLKNPPPLVQVIYGAYGEGLAEGSAHLYVGQPPALAAVDLKSGKEVRLGAAPPEIFRTAVRKDGRYAAFTALDPDRGSGFLVWLADLTTGTLTRTPFAYETAAGWPVGFDAKGRLVAGLNDGRVGTLDPATGTAEVQDSAALFWGELTPDGRYLIGRDGEPGAYSTGAWVPPPRARHLVVRDLSTGQERVFDWDVYAGAMGALKDGRLVVDYLPGDQELKHDESVMMAAAVVEPVTGKLTPYPQRWQEPYSPADSPYKAPDPAHRYLALLPDGRALVLVWPNLPNQRGPLGP